MEKSYTHTGPNYNLNVSLLSNVLEIILTITEGEKVTKYYDLFINLFLPYKIDRVLKTVKKLFTFLEKKENFQID